MAEMAAEYKLKELIRMGIYISERIKKLHENLTSKELGPKYFTNVDISQDVEALIIVCLLHTLLYIL